MAEQIISPGVFTRENDQSFLPQGVGAIGAAIVGPTVKGPAFIPTVVRSFSEYERRFGGLSKDTFVPQTVREYLRNAGSVTVCRVLAGGGYKFTDNTNEPIAIYVGNESATAVFATSSITISKIPDNILEGAPDTVNVGPTTFVFVKGGIGSQGFVSSETEKYVLHGASPTVATSNLVTAINASPSTSSITASIDPNGSNIIQITGSVAGIGGNIKIHSGSGADDGTFKIAFASSTGQNGGVDAVTANNTLLSIIYPSKNIDLPSLQDSEITSPITPSATASFNLNLAGTSVTSTAISTTLDPGKDNYIFNILGDSPDNSKSGVIEYKGTPGYSYLNFKSIQKGIQSTSDLEGYSVGSGSKIYLSKLENDLSFNGDLAYGAEGYSYASTPFITSHLNDNKELFKFHSIGHGTECNMDYKISIANLREPDNIDNELQYSTFTILVRKYGDNDKSPVILEQYNNVNLNPDSPKYIARVIGDRYPLYNDTLGKVELLGNYPNISPYIRVEVSDAVDSKSTSPKLSPKGFATLINPIPTSSFAKNFIIPSASYEGVQNIGGNYNTRGYLGWKFDDKELDNSNFIKPLPSTIESNIAGAFNVENYNGHPSSSLWAGSLSASIDTTGVNGPTSEQLKFTVPFQGGFDGIAPYQVKFAGNESKLHANYTAGTNLYGFDMSNGSAGSEGYKKAINILSNQDEYDINMLSIPGVIKSLHPGVTNAGVDMCEERGDTFYVMDLSQYNSSVNTVINDANGLDTNYAATYYPWVKVLDTAQNKPVLVPPSVIVPGAIAASDRIAAEWFAPAGLNRGVLGNVIEAKMRLNQAERDLLYNAKINPIATFPQTGVCIWGQKTLQERSSALDRINVRRLLIALKKFIASSSRYLVFEQNTNATRNRFLNIVNPYLESVQQRQGLYSFRVQMDESNNTADVVDRNQLVGAIYLQPTKTAEFIVLDFNVLPTGATFDGGGSGGY